MRPLLVVVAALVAAAVAGAKTPPPDFTFTLTVGHERYLCAHWQAARPYILCVAKKKPKTGVA